MIRRSSRSVLYLPLFLFLAASLHASTFLAMSRHELAREADAIIQGRVVEVVSFWNADVSLIVTEATIQVEEQLAGNLPSVVVVRTFGGEVGNFRIVAHGFPAFEQGERAVLFLQKEESDNSLRVLGYQQGHWRVVHGDLGVDLAVPTVDEGARLIFRDGRVAPEAVPEALDRFKSSIREHVRGGRFAR